MIGKIIAWILELFRKKPKKQQELEMNIEDLKTRIEEIGDEKISTDDINNHFNK